MTKRTSRFILYMDTNGNVTMKLKGMYRIKAENVIPDKLRYEVLYISDLIKFLKVFDCEIRINTKNGTTKCLFHGHVFFDITSDVVDSFEESDFVLYDKSRNLIEYRKINVNKEDYKIKKVCYIYMRKNKISLDLDQFNIINSCGDIDEFMLFYGGTEIKITKDLKIKYKKDIYEQIDLEVNFPYNIDFFKKSENIKDNIFISYNSNTLKIKELKI